MGGFPGTLHCDAETSAIIGRIIAHVDHGKIHPRGPASTPVRHARCCASESAADALRRIRTALERERRHHHFGEEHGHHLGRFPHQHRGHRRGYADFGGEVERVLAMVDCVLLLVDAVDGPMPQTRFVTQKAFKHGLRPIVVINKIDRDEARPGWVLDQTFDLFDQLGATDEQLDFPVVYASALTRLPRGSTAARCAMATCRRYSKTIVDHCPPPDVDSGRFKLQLQVHSLLDYSSYVGAIAVGRIKRGTLKKGMAVTVIDREGKTRPERITQVLGFHGLTRVEVESAFAGDIVAFAGIPEPKVSDTVCDPLTVEALPSLTVDEPTISMTFEVNTSPFLGRDGKFVTSRQIRERLDRESIHNVALRVPSPPPIRTSSWCSGAANCTWGRAAREHAARRLRNGGVARAWWSSSRSTA